MQTVLLPAGWEHHAAPAATLLDGLGDPWLWWIASLLLLLAGCMVRSSRPRLCVALAAGATLALGIACNGLVDDAYIQFRYAANLAAGHGPVFNPGERVEGASGGTWVAAIAVVRTATGADAARAGRLLSLAAAVGATLAAAAFGRAIAGRRGAATAALLWAALPTPALYSATGLETAAFTLSLWMLGAAVAGGRSGPAGAAGAAAATLRPEGIVMALGTLPFARRLGRAGRSALAGSLGASALMACARYLYYGLPVPRSAVVKGVTAAAGIGSGLRYLGQAACEWWPLLFFLPWIARRDGRLLPVLVPAMVWTVLVVARGGDWMPGGRYLLPVVIILIGSAAAALGEELTPAPAGTGATTAGTIAMIAGTGATTTRWPSLSRRLGRAVPFASVAWGLLLLAPLERPSNLPAGRSWRAMAEHRVQSRWWEATGAWLKRTVPPSTLLAAGPIGALPYASGLRTFDMYGLCSPVTGTREGEPGHRLWGLREAVESGAGVVYPGQGVPQVDDWNAVLDRARLHVADVNDFEQRFRPIGISHLPEYHLDLVRDVVWFQAGLVDEQRSGP